METNPPSTSCIDVTAQFNTTSIVSVSSCNARTPPPSDTHLVNDTLSSITSPPDAEMDAWMAPPRPPQHEQRVNVRPESVNDPDSTITSKTVPFPKLRWTSVKVVLMKVNAYADSVKGGRENKGDEESEREVNSQSVIEICVTPLIKMREEEESIDGESSVLTVREERVSTPYRASMIG